MDQREFARRRRQLMRMMGEGAIAVVPGASLRYRSRDVEYPFRQDSDFHYLTGFPEPEAVAVLVPGRPQGEYILFCRERDPETELWTGPVAGPEGACERYGADDAFPVSDLDDILPGLIEGCERVYYTMGTYPDIDRRMIGYLNELRRKVRAGARTPEEFVALDHLLHDMRLYKSRAELRAMREAARIAMGAHRRAMAACRPGLREHEIEAELLYEFRRHGAEPAYPPIVASGPSACILHYTANDRRMEDGELLLIDAGCEHDCYASDITRTFPVGGRFGPEQRALYELVLEAQEAAIAAVRPGNHWNDPHDAAVRVLTRGLVRLGLLEGRPARLVRKGAYRRFFPHRTGHWLGLDVHDVGEYKVDEAWRLLEAGMVLTVEPGLYIPPDARGVRKRWRGIGIRIEDDVAVTADGCQVLTAALPKDPDTIEAMVGA